MDRRESDVWLRRGRGMRARARLQSGREERLASNYQYSMTTHCTLHEYEGIVIE